MPRGKMQCLQCMRPIVHTMEWRATGLVLCGWLDWMWRLFYPKKLDPFSDGLDPPERIDGKILHKRWGSDRVNVTRVVSVHILALDRWREKRTELMLQRHIALLTNDHNQIAGNIYCGGLFRRNIFTTQILTTTDIWKERVADLLSGAIIWSFKNFSLSFKSSEYSMKQTSLIVCFFVEIKIWRFLASPETKCWIDSRYFISVSISGRSSPMPMPINWIFDPSTDNNGISRWNESSSAVCFGSMMPGSKSWWRERN